MSSEFTTPSFAREMTDQELDSVNGGARVIVIVIVDENGHPIGVIVIS